MANYLAAVKAFYLAHPAVVRAAALFVAGALVGHFVL